MTDPIPASPNPSRATRIAAIAPVVIFAFLAVALWFGMQRDPATLPSVLIGKPFPAFALGPVRAGDVGFSSADIKGKVVVGVLSGGNVDTELFARLIAG